MLNRIFGYTMVNTKKESLEKQIESLKKYNENIEIIEDVVSLEEPDNMINYMLYRMRGEIQKGDQFVVTSIDRLGQDKGLIKERLEELRNDGIIVRVLDIPTTLIDPPKGQEYILDIINNLLIEIVSIMAEKERKNIKTRQIEETDKAKANGKHLGRPKATYPANWEEVYIKLIREDITAVKAMKLLGLKKSTFYKLKNQYEERNGKQTTLNTCSKTCS